MAKARKDSRFEVFGQEMIEKIVAKSGNSGRIYLPPDWIGKRVKIIRVDPAFQGHGVGKALGEALLKHFKEKGVAIVRTLVEWHAGDMIAYLKGLGFDRSDLIPLERRG